MKKKQAKVLTGISKIPVKIKKKHKFGFRVVVLSGASL